jgi:RNA polymerase sigma-70 factor, ECF subfamily
VTNRQENLTDVGDEELVLRSLVSDFAAFDELVRRFRRPVLAVAEQELRCREAAEDVVQDAFLLAFKALPQLEDPSKFAGWLCAIARHRARRVGARDGRSLATETLELDRLLLESMPQLAPDVLNEVVRKFEGEAVRLALSRLPEDYRAVLFLYYFEDWSVSQISGFLSLTNTTTKWRLHHGRELMRRQLTPERGTIHDERDNPEQARGEADQPHAPGNGKGRAGGEHDRGAARRRPNRRRPVQPVCELPRAGRQCADRLLSAAG